LEKALREKEEEFQTKLEEMQEQNEQQRLADQVAILSTVLLFVNVRIQKDVLIRLKQREFEDQIAASEEDCEKLLADKQRELEAEMDAKRKLQSEFELLEVCSLC